MELPGTFAPVEPVGFGRGYVDHLTLTQPAAGAALVQALDPSFVWRPLSVRFTLTTDANVASRFVSVDYCDPEGGVWVRNAAGVVVAASTTAQQFDFNAQRGLAEWASGTDILVPLSDFFVPGGFQLRINVGSIQAGDQIASARFYCEKWLTGPSEGQGGPAGGAAIPIGARR